MLDFRIFALDAWMDGHKEKWGRSCTWVTMAIIYTRSPMDVSLSTVGVVCKRRFCGDGCTANRVVGPSNPTYS
jgi:hypothetical protein